MGSLRVAVFFGEIFQRVSSSKTLITFDDYYLITFLGEDAVPSIACVTVFDIIVAQCTPRDSFEFYFRVIGIMRVTVFTRTCKCTT